MAGHAKDGTLLFAHHAHQDDDDDGGDEHPPHDEMKRSSMPRTRSRDLRENVSLHTSVIKRQEFAIVDFSKTISSEGHGCGAIGSGD